MSERVRFLRDWDFRPRPSVVMVYKAGEEKRLPQAQVEAALADKAVEIIDGSGGTRKASAKVGGLGSEDAAVDRPSDPAGR